MGTNLKLLITGIFTLWILKIISDLAFHEFFQDLVRKLLLKIKR